MAVGKDLVRVMLIENRDIIAILGNPLWKRGLLALWPVRRQAKM